MSYAAYKTLKSIGSNPQESDNIACGGTDEVVNSPHLSWVGIVCLLVAMFSFIHYPRLFGRLCQSRAHSDCSAGRLAKPPFAETTVCGNNSMIYGVVRIAWRWKTEIYMYRWIVWPLGWPAPYRWTYGLSSFPDQEHVYRCAQCASHPERSSCR